MFYDILNDDCIKLNVDKLAQDNIGLVYFDPPYGSKAQDSYYGVGSSREEYLDYIRQRVERLKVIENFNLVIHVDYKNSHYIKVMLDDIFGENSFRNDIVWCYSGPSVCKNWFPRKHDNLLWYGIGNNVFNAQRIPHKGKLNVGGKSSWAKKDVDITDYLTNGKLLEDFWTDIPALVRNESEKVGYPTQKPLALLERLILALSREGQTVVDLMMGSGTTGVEAVKNKRRFVGCDISKQACDIAIERIKNADC